MNDEDRLVTALALLTSVFITAYAAWDHAVVLTIVAGAAAAFGTLWVLYRSDERKER